MKNLLLILLVLSFSQSSIAMTCMTEKVTKKFKKADFVFEAKVKSRLKLDQETDGICWAEGESCGSKIATVEIGEVWKGKFDSLETTVYSEDGCYCLGTYLPVGSRYVVFGKKSDSGQYEVSDMGACWTEPYEHVEKKTFKELTKLKKRANK